MSCCSSRAPVARSDWDPYLERFVKYLTSGSDAIRMKQAIEVGTKSVEYFRGQDLPKWLSKHQTQIKNKFPQVLHQVLGDEKVDFEQPAALAQALGAALIAGGFIVRAEHRPLAQRETPADGSTGSLPEETETTPVMQVPAHLRDSAKWPRRVGITKANQKFDEAGFFVVAYEGANRLNHLVLAGIIVAVLLACLFPIWPFRLKIAMWYLGVAFSITMVILIIVRLVLFIGLWFGGCDFWFLPNFFNEDVGFVDSFIPVYTFEKRKDDMVMIAARIFAAVLCVGAFYKLSETHSLSDMGNVASKGFLDILDWGHQKLADTPANDPAVVTPITEESIPLTQEELETQKWNECVPHCEFADYEEFTDFCYTDCECMSELWSSNCWKRCADEGIRDKIRAKHEACEREVDDVDDLRDEL